MHSKTSSLHFVFPSPTSVSQEEGAGQTGSTFSHGEEEGDGALHKDNKVSSGKHRIFSQNLSKTLQQ
jgi:hypothetical protein